MVPNLSNLPLNDRIQLVEDLWDSIAADQAALSLTTEQKAELDQRLNAYEVDKIKGRLANKVISDLKKRL